jgi:hypothetical protein
MLPGRSPRSPTLLASISGLSRRLAPPKDGTQRRQTYELGRCAAGAVGCYACGQFSGAAGPSGWVG